MLAIGTVIGGKYRVDRLLGVGGMGVVFAATHLGLDTAVAVKLLRREHADDPTAASRLLREARTVATLKSEHVARVLDVGTHEGSPFLVMELLEGRTLHDVVTHERGLDVTTAVDVVVQACHALGDAHRRGVVHRDVKPSNLFLVGPEAGARTLKVIDFGISKARPLAADNGSVETRTGTLLGSPAFMSPEQIRSSSEVDGRSDIWSLGVVLYFALTGRKPFEGESLLDLMTSIVHEPPVPLRLARPDAPEPIEAILARCLEKDRARRFATTAELAMAIAPWASARMRALAATVPVATVTAAEPPASVAPSRRPSPPPATVEATETFEVPAAGPPTHTVTLPASAEAIEAPVPATQQHAPPVGPRRRRAAALAVVAGLLAMAGVAVFAARAASTSPAGGGPPPPAAAAADPSSTPEPALPPPEIAASSAPRLAPAVPASPLASPVGRGPGAPRKVGPKPTARTPASAEPPAVVRPELPRTPD